MLKFNTLLIILATVVCATSGYMWQPGGAACGCFNHVYVDKPKSIADCSPKTKFLSQIFQNYNNVNFALLINASPVGCDLAKYRYRIYEMKEKTLKMVEAYFSCVESNCTTALMSAYNKYVDFVAFDFNPYTRCAFTNFNRGCAQALVENRPPVHGSAENILVALLTCAKLRAEAHSGKVQSLIPAPANHNNEVECNCIKIDPRPIPKDECECYSTKYYSTLHSYIEVNFDRVFAEYKANLNTSCEYTELIGYTEQLKQLSLTMMALLEKASPQFFEFDEYYKQFTDLLLTYNLAMRTYNLKNDKSCYYTARKARQNPIAIAEAVIGILTKCLGYKVLGDDRCSVFLK
ncbi:uncharacterized protein LOC119083467 [Bradysia coprophila]|uniref:uncharacterized protein LOC119083467 n=1 Tax=Bradysia coprophila TaxID=38358 RepID=UPI00187D7119|nr:uncharacterized protein LOC119083467 [Bradysia coprophila]